MYSINVGLAFAFAFPFPRAESQGNAKARQGSGYSEGSETAEDASGVETRPLATPCASVIGAAAHGNSGDILNR